MTHVEVRPIVSLSSSGGLVKMEERKRPAPCDNDESVPPLKRQATAVNGATRGHSDPDMPGRDDLEKFQKEALWRQMQEYKREKITLETRLNDLIKRAVYHDDHLRIIDAWFTQLLDEVKISSGQIENHDTVKVFPSTLLSADNAIFESHLKTRSSEISAAISHLFSHKTVSSPDTGDFQGRVAQLLLAEKAHVNELEKSRLEKEQLEERLESASMRYMVAEKKLDRAKSLTVAKLERQALASGRYDTGSGLSSSGVDGQGGGKNDLSNGLTENGETLAEVEEARKEAVAASAKQKEQLERIEAENEKLISQLTALNVKYSHLSDDDYARSDLFKYLKSQHEDVIKRINDLEAINVQLREEAAKLQAERTAYRIQLETESQAAVSEKDAQLARAESDLARIRTARDELSADIQMRKVSQDQDRASSNQTKQLAAAREDRIKALESEAERLRVHAGQLDCLAISDEGLAQLPIDELRTKYSNLNRQYAMLGQELSSMGTAYKRASAQASQKINDTVTLEEKVHRLGAEKSKADQKYFAAMKAKEAREQEARTFRVQNSKSSEIVSQLKDAEVSTRALVVNLEKHLAETKEALNNTTKHHRTCQQQVAEKSIATEGLKAQVEELKRTISAKDTSTSTLSAVHRRAEVELEELKVKLEETKKSLEMWKSKGLGNQSGEYEMLRNLAICTVCRKNFKDTVLKPCGHIFCKDCVDERLQSRMRKCPNCNKAFGQNDHMRVTL